MKNLNILHEDNHIIIVEKRAGLLTQGDSSGSPTLIEKIKKYIKIKHNKPGDVFLGMVQRLDKPVSGTLVFAKTSKAAKRLNEEFRKRDVIKMYLAVVHGGDHLEKGKWNELTHYISKDDGYIQIDDHETKGGKKALLKFIKISSGNDSSLFLVKLETGLKHQIRAQLSKIGFPIIGDKKYGSTVKFRDESILLHSYYLEFSHPTTKESVKVYSGFPGRFLDHGKIDDDVEMKIQQLIHQP